MQSRIRLALPLLGVLMAAPLGQAEAQSLTFGITGGASLSTFTGDLVEDAKNYSTYIVGGFVRIGAMGFAVQPGLYYAGKGAKSDGQQGSADVTTKLNYIQVPLVLRLRLGNMLYVGAGPAIGFNVGCKISTTAAGYGGGTDCKNIAPGYPDANSTEISGIVEAGLEFGKFSIGARGDLGITNAIDAVQSGTVTSADVRTRTVSVVAAIRF